MTVKLHISLLDLEQVGNHSVTLHVNYRSQYDHHDINYSWARGGEGHNWNLGKWIRSRLCELMFKFQSNVQRGRAQSSKRPKCEITKFVRGEFDPQITGGRSFCTNQEHLFALVFTAKLREKKTELTIVPMLCNSFVNPNSALSPNDCIFFLGLGLTDRSCYTLGLFCKKQKHNLSDLSQATRQLFLI